MRIGKLAEATGATTATLRYYEDEGLLPPAERSPPAGYRDYAADTIARVGFIRRGDRPPGSASPRFGRSSTSVTAATRRARTCATCSTSD